MVARERHRAGKAFVTVAFFTLEPWTAEPTSRVTP
jgi:hypothetical protein